MFLLVSSIPWAFFEQAKHPISTPNLPLIYNFMLFVAHVERIHGAKGDCHGVTGGLDEENKG